MHTAGMWHPWTDILKVGLWLLPPAASSPST